MWDLLEISIQSFPLGSFLAMLVAFWALGLFLTRGEAEWRKMPDRSRKVVPLEGPRRVEPHTLPSDQRHAA